VSDNHKQTGTVALLAVCLGLSYLNIYAPLIPLAALIIYWLAVWMKNKFPTT
jgi:hypothetical protein